MTQERIDRFMAEYKKLCKDFGMSFQDPEYNSLNLRDDVKDEIVSYNADLEAFTATLYVPRLPTFGPLTAAEHQMREVTRANLKWYADAMLDRLKGPMIAEMMKPSKATVSWRKVEHK